MRRLLAVAAAVLLAATVAGCGGGPDVPQLTGGGAGPSKVVVDSPELRQVKADAGVEDCAPGPGGGSLPALTLPCLGGGTSVDLSTLRGPLVLSLWQAGCAPCRKEMPALQEFHETYGSQVPVIGVDILDPFPASALDEIAKRNVTYPSLADPGGDLQGFEQFAKLPGMPTMYFVDAAGDIAYLKPGGVDSADEIADLVTEHLGVAL